MKRFCILACGLLFAAVGSSATAQTAADQTFSFVRIVADAKGGSAFIDDEMRMFEMSQGPNIPPTAATGPIRSRAMTILCPPAGGEAGWHAAPRQLINIVLSGKVEVEVTSGEKREFGPGDVIQLEDTTGKGHVTRVLSDEGACFASVTDAR
ncbi:MAG: DUF861 domain-containing protein [Bacteroidetes bacterium]|nr:DUF861 domain-containing protein [Bacteroidota bacterium]